MILEKNFFLKKNTSVLKSFFYVHYSHALNEQKNWGGVGGSSRHCSVEMLLPAIQQLPGSQQSPRMEGLIETVLPQPLGRVTEILGIKDLVRTGRWIL